MGTADAQGSSDATPSSAEHSDRLAHQQTGTLPSCHFGRKLRAPFGKHTFSQEAFRISLVMLPLVLASRNLVSSRCIRAHLKPHQLRHDARKSVISADSTRSVTFATWVARMDLVRARQHTKTHYGHQENHADAHVGCDSCARTEHMKCRKA